MRRVAVAALAVCALAMAIAQVAAFGPAVPHPLHMAFWRFAHIAPTGFELALVALLALDG